MSETGSDQVWMKGPAKAFRETFGEQVFHLACHAAVPVVLSSDLLHLLRINFFLDSPEAVDYVAESQILLSPLCNEVGSGLYEIPPAVRDSLLHELAAHSAYGEVRIREIATLLFEYSERFSPWKDNLMIERAQQLTALNFLDPEAAKTWLESAEQAQSNAGSDREWFIAMRSELRKLDSVLSSSRNEEATETEDVTLSGLQLLRSFKAHDEPIGRFAWSPDGRQLATPSADKTVKIWNARTGRLIRTLSGHKERVICVAWSPRGRMLASGSDDQTARIWDVESGRVIDEIHFSSSVASLDWSPDGASLVLGFNDSTVSVWRNGQIFKSRRAWGMVTSLKWSPDGRQFAVASEDDTLVEVWNAQTLTSDGRTLQHREQMLALDWSADGKLIATGCSDGTVWLWESSGEKPAKILEGHNGIVNAVSFSPDCRIVASKSHDGTVRIWRTDTGEMVSILPKQGAHFVVSGIAFNPKQAQLATLGDHDTVINIWHVDFALLSARTIEIPETNLATTKIILLGPSGVGKTSLVRALQTSHSEVSASQISHADLLTVHFPDGVRGETFVWDFDLPDPLLAKILLADADIVLWLFDVRNLASLDELERYRNALRMSLRRGVRSVWVGLGKRSEDVEDLTVALKRRTGGRRDYWFVDLADESQNADLIARLKLEISRSSRRRPVDIWNVNTVENQIYNLKQQSVASYIRFNTLISSLSKSGRFSERQLRRCLWHLDRSGKIRLLRSSSNEEIVWLEPAEISRLLGIIVDEARANSTTPGRVAEHHVTNLIQDRHLTRLSQEATILRDCTGNLLVDRKVCYRESGELVFPEVISQRQPQVEPTYHEEQHEFDRLLAWLKPNRELAGEKYEEIRNALIELFAQRGTPDPEELADETIDRVIKKLDVIAPNYVGDPAFYFYGVAKSVLQENTRRSRSFFQIDSLSQFQTPEHADSNVEIEYEYLEKCLAQLSEENRDLILAYYGESKLEKIKARERLAQDLKLDLPALRIRAYRLRSQLKACIEKCLKREVLPLHHEHKKP